LSVIALADCRDGSAPAFDTLRERVRAALLPTAKAA
jgi:hypothetical protein